MPTNWSVEARIGPKVTVDPVQALAKFAAGQWGVVSRAELAACGLSDKQVKRMVARGHLHPLHRGVYAVGHRNVVTEGRFLAAVKACGPEAVSSHHAGCCLRGWLRYDGRPIDVTAPTKRTRPTIKTHRSELVERVIVRQIPTTPPLRTIIDLARVEEERTVKRALRAARFTEAELQLLPRTGLLGRILDLSAAPTASGNEDEVLDLVLKAGFTHPLVNARYPGSGYIPDLWWPEQCLLVEVDSLEWHSDPLAQRADLDRQAWLEAKGERVLRTTRAQVRRDPARFIARLRAAGAPLRGA
ncbi:type IV toxin-antitoxin system AbiEi family antitoxin domain-containing protein [Solirubrobacter sp. CPCC 204708]|uniref:Type IV toxin-antitoxin system AbiEi family antitoxin domain-containing protein n=1 Tax=Solirubrobacter deserti TaxID=2282478 RepID=A0ABT4RUR0_9ACTN|nr:type IV toxin-antitoxin system AbiEi family antitoxin domain-containing protein [Solirubrobacter deserti]MBE2319326.1 type IV toxin-antitoxin system AbiEi family antitoxin domain-containing protein [Solirubrobacter deserti]MDA0142312.1 type IV toxin-antitoxin system AbiEi family antitoxin domain-containing protein [Solirubrobacter deserti]